MAKINNLAIPGGGPDPLSPPLDPPMISLTTNHKFDASKLLKVSLVIPSPKIMKYFHAQLS